MPVEKMIVAQPHKNNYDSQHACIPSQKKTEIEVSFTLGYPVENICLPKVGKS